MLHPAIRADWLVLRRTGPRALIRALGAPVLLLACCVAIACGDAYGGYEWCLAASALLALGGSYAIAHQRLLDALERWRYGWCGALPVARGAAVWTLLLVTAAALMVSLVFVTALLLGVSASAPHRGDLPYALAGIELALVLGTVVAAARVLRRGWIARMHQAEGIREPLLALQWLNDSHLPHLLDWQRRSALVRWRRGGSFALVGAALAAVPHGSALPVVVALVLLLLSLVWLGVVMRACADVSTAAGCLLGATPLAARRLRITAFRYPFVAALCALLPMVIGALLSRRGVVALGWLICALLASAWPVARIVHATRNPESST